MLNEEENMTVIKLTLDHHEDVLDLFHEELEHYYFLINDLLDQQYENNAFRVYGEYAAGKLQSILLNNEPNLTYYARTDRSIEVYLDALKNCRFTKISGPSLSVSKLIPYVKVAKESLSYLGVVKEVSTTRRFPELTLHTVETDTELGMQFDLFASAKEYALNTDRDAYIQSEVERLKSTQDRIVYLSVDDQMVASCATIRETRNSAIIIGVVTHPLHRRQGYGTETLVGLFDQLLEEGKYPYLFYDNPAARSVYKNLGMTEVCEWKVIEVEGE